MTRYPHFAFPNLFLLNGYRELETHHGLELEYEQEDGLEQCIRRLVVRKPERLRGWDLRFLRRGLNLSQAQLGELVDRDAQSIARWEKTSDAIPSAIDLVIRTRFAARFEPTMSTQEILSYLDGKDSTLPTSIFLRLTSQGWQFELEPIVKFARSNAYGEALVRVGPGFGRGFSLFEHFVSGKTGSFVIEPSLGRELLVLGTQSTNAIQDAIATEPSQATALKLNIDIKGSANDNARATIH